MRCITDFYHAMCKQGWFSSSLGTLYVFWNIYETSLPPYQDCYDIKTKTCDTALQEEDVTIGLIVGERLNSLRIVMYLVMYLCIYVSMDGHCSFWSQYSSRARTNLEYFMEDHLSFSLALNISILVGTNHNRLSGRCMLFLGGTYIWNYTIAISCWFDQVWMAQCSFSLLVIPKVENTWERIVI